MKKRFIVKVESVFDRFRDHKGLSISTSYSSADIKKVSQPVTIRSIRSSWPAEIIGVSIPDKFEISMDSAHFEELMTCIDTENRFDIMYQSDRIEF